MKFYELAYLVTPDASADTLRDLSQKLQNLIESGGGVLDVAAEPVRKRLAYIIKHAGGKYDTAHFVYIFFYSSPENILALTEAIKSEKSVLRFLLITHRSPDKKAAIKTRRAIQKRFVPGEIITKEPKVDLEKIEEKLEELLGA